MYLATIELSGKKHYEIRQSVPDPERLCYQFKTIFDLGLDPTRHIRQITDDICYFSTELREKIEQHTSADPTTLLENILWDFLPAEERFRLERFRYRGRAGVSALTEQDRAAIEREVHLFDRRRLYYLRYGAVDQSKLFRLNPKLYRPLLKKCRDEREYYFRDLEKSLQHNELKTYVFATFDLQRHFNASYSATMPEALDQVDIADHYVNDLCRLNADQQFWLGDVCGSSLHHHLIRYVIMFFDHGYGKRSLFDDFLREFMGRHRAFKWPDKKPSVSTTEATAIFGKAWPDLQKMNKVELTRLYRKRAKELHPDSGGDHERFVRLNAAYASLLVRK